jgi:hypothetical protein
MVIADDKPYLLDYKVCLLIKSEFGRQTHAYSGTFWHCTIRHLSYIEYSTTYSVYMYLCVIIY